MHAERLLRYKGYGEWIQQIDSTLKAFESRSHAPRTLAPSTGPCSPSSAAGAAEGDNAMARETFEEGLEISKKLGDLQRITVCQGNLANDHAQDGHDADNSV